jgi:hypothetical protein
MASFQWLVALFREAFDRSERSGRGEAIHDSYLGVRGQSRYNC